MCAPRTAIMSDSQQDRRSTTLQHAARRHGRLRTGLVTRVRLYHNNTTIALHTAINAWAL